MGLARMVRTAHSPPRPLVVYGPDMNLDQLRELASDEQGLCVASVIGDDGRPHASVVNAGVLGHPGDGSDIVGFVTRGGSVKHRRLRIHPYAALTFRRGWRWVGVAGRVDLIGPDDFTAEANVDVADLLRAIFIAAGGTHDDWGEYDRVMSSERRLAVLVHAERVTGTVPG